MINLTLPPWVTKIISTPLQFNRYSQKDIAQLKQKLSRYQCSNPLVSIVIPAWNEEKGILHTLISLANSNTFYDTELIVVDNNSTDGTVELLRTLGVKILLEKKQGIGHARTKGLHEAKGVYMLTCDCDTIYPTGWITAMTKPMIDGTNKSVTCVHGSYSFLPGINTPRWQYCLYELLSGLIIRRNEKTHAHLNVLGFNCGLVRQAGINVNGYDIPIQRTFRGTPNETNTPAAADGMMAWRLREAGGKIMAALDKDARVWTSDRRIEIDGGIKKAFIMRVKKHLIK